MRDNSADLQHIFLNDIPLMDVRAPVEFTKGAFAQAINLPLMNDAEREAVGTAYKQQGQQSAIELGHRLVSGDIQQARIEAWAEFARRQPEGYLYCFRGGLRSQITQQWLKDIAGVPYPRVLGGYKAMRTFLIETTDQAVQACELLLVGGLTGSGKTEVLVELDNGLDLEGHANHRGSSFGKRVSGQPGQIDFENALAVDILKKRHRGACGAFIAVPADASRADGLAARQCRAPRGADSQGLCDRPLRRVHHGPWRGSRIQYLCRATAPESGE
jgi:tRNA 2-selenouridine synthase